MRVHEGIKYNCNYCSKSFVEKRALQNHLSQHTGHYRFTCDVCGKGFNTKINYDKHIENHMS